MAREYNNSDGEDIANSTWNDNTTRECVDVAQETISVTQESTRVMARDSKSDVIQSCLDITHSSMSLVHSHVNVGVEKETATVRVSSLTGDAVLYENGTNTLSNESKPDPSAYKRVMVQRAERQQTQWKQFQSIQQSSTPSTATDDDDDVKGTETM